VAIFDHTPSRAKTGIASRYLKPYLGIVDPCNTITLPVEVTKARFRAMTSYPSDAAILSHGYQYSGLDVLCHSIESYTALPFTERYFL
jgi:hydroxyacid-oxoacid transhydrogenase